MRCGRVNPNVEKLTPHLIWCSFKRNVIYIWSSLSLKESHLNAGHHLQLKLVWFIRYTAFTPKTFRASGLHSKFTWRRVESDAPSTRLHTDFECKPDLQNVTILSLHSKCTGIELEALDAFLTRVTRLVWTMSTKMCILKHKVSKS